ncbi:MAG TPA: hypothetical protein VL088_00970 [Pedobacter sp.]|nr:hypothetical protein [Pedobacter sp.]
MFKYKLCLSFVLVGSLLACNTQDATPLSIRFSADSSSILVSNIEPAALLQLKNNIKTDTLYQKVVSVLETPADDDSTSMEREWPGKLSMQGEDLVFRPDSPFIKGKSYLLETILNTQFAGKGDITRSEIGHQVKRQQKILKF